MGNGKSRSKNSVCEQDGEHVILNDILLNLKNQLEYWNGAPLPQMNEVTRVREKSEKKKKYLTVQNLIKSLEAQIEFWKDSLHKTDDVDSNSKSEDIMDKSDVYVTKEQAIISIQKQILFWEDDLIELSISEKDGIYCEMMTEGQVESLRFQNVRKQNLSRETESVQLVKGTTSGPVLSYAEASSHIPMTIDEMWSIAKKTSDKEGMVLKPIRNRKSWKNIRIFVSSTFRDFYQEREVLVKEIFPDLRLWCEERKLRLVECDLRWGVPADTSSEETIRICMEELDRCKEENIEPFFLNLIGNRVGWIPQIGDMSDTLAEMYGWVYGLSVTEMEILNGAFRRLNPNACFLIRSIEGLDEVSEVVREPYFDRSDHQLKKLQALRSNISERFPNSHYTYKVSAKKHNEKLEFYGLSGEESFFCKTITNFFRSRIEEQYPLDSSPSDTLLIQKATQEAFIESRSQRFFGRVELTKEIDAYCFSDSTRLPLLVIGEAGVGKSSVIAKCAKNAQYYAENDLIDVPAGYTKWKTFYHFVGATPGSTDLIFFLRRLIKELNPDAKETIADLNELLWQSSNLLSNEASAPMLVFIDAVNQIDDDKQHLFEQWLPNKLSPNIRVVLSTIEETKSHLTLRSYKPPLNELYCGPLDDKSKKEIVSSIFKTFNKKLDRSQMLSLIAKRGSSNPLWLTFACEELRVHGTFEGISQKIQELPDDLIDVEMQVISRFENQSGGKMMKSALCLLEVSKQGLLETELVALLGKQKSAECPSLSEGCNTQQTADTLKSVADPKKPQSTNKRTSIADEKSIKVTEKVYGNSTDPEYLQDKNKYKSVLPARDWAVIYRNLKPLLRPCGDLSEGILDFYHQSLSEAVRRKYFTSGSDEANKEIYNYWHGVLVDHFETVSDIERRAEELPYQLEKVQDINRLAKCLLERPIFNRMFDDYFSIDLLQFWQKCGGLSIAAEMYMNTLTLLKQSGASDIEFSDHAYKVGTFLVQAGKYDESYQILEGCVALNVSDNSKLADVYASMAYCKSIHLCTRFDITKEELLKEHKKVVELCLKSNEYRQELFSEEQEYKRAKNNIELSYSLSECSDHEKALVVINEAITTFEKFNDIGMLARCLLRKSNLITDWDVTLTEVMKAYGLCRKAYGENHYLYADICFNLGETYRLGVKEYDRAYAFYEESKKTLSKLYGPDHPETIQLQKAQQMKVFDDIRPRQQQTAPSTA